jgi:hypothetical protein
LKLYRILNSIDYFQNQVYEAFEAAGLVESIEKIVTRTALLALLAKSLRAQPGLKVATGIAKLLQGNVSLSRKRGRRLPAP